MRVLRYLLPTVAAALTISTAGFGGTPETERDTEALTAFVKGKRTISVADKGGDLALSGNVRFEYQSITESVDGLKVRGSSSGTNAGTLVPNHVFDTEVNLMLDYTADKTWAAIKLEFDNDNGIQNDWQRNSLKMERAYFGYNVMEEDTARFDFELGRRNLYDVFDSKIQFNNHFDGILLKYANSFEAVGDFYLNGGMWIVDDRVDHYAWAAEAGLMDFMDSGLYAKYSYIDWDNTGVDHTGEKSSRLWKSRNSQFLLGYKFQPEVLRTDLNLYAAYLMNHAAKKISATRNKKENDAWYIGARFGKVEYAGDWSFDINYQSVEAQAILDSEVAGVGRGNVAGNVFSSVTDFNIARGNANYKGWAAEGLYALTDNLTFLMEYETSDANNKNIGGRNSYHKFEMEAIYSF